MEDPTFVEIPVSHIYMVRVGDEIRVRARVTDADSRTTEKIFHGFHMGGVVFTPGTITSVGKPEQLVMADVSHALLPAQNGYIPVPTKPPYLFGRRLESDPKNTSIMFTDIIQVWVREHVTTHILRLKFNRMVEKVNANLQKIATSLKSK